MPPNRNEPALATLLCTELLTAAELKTLCQTRGFPTAGVGKDALAKSAAARLLEPAGVARAMAALEPRWLRALHVIVATDKPVDLYTLARAVTPERGRYFSFEARSFWREVTAGLLARGVALAVDGEPRPGQRSRFERLSFVLPASFVALLPPFPIAVTAVAGAGVQGDVDDLLTAALDHFARGIARGADGVTARIAAMLRIERAHLRLEGLDRPDGAHVARLVRAVHRGSLDAAKGSPGEPGPFALHILAHLPPDTACDAATLADALAELALPPAPDALPAFLEAGVRAGVLARFDRPKQPPLYRAAASAPVASCTTLQLTATAKGVAVAPAGSGLVPVLQAASVARAAIADGAIVLEPDPVRLGRGWHELPPSVQADLVAASPAFRDATERVERRRGQVIVHEGLTLLRIEDAALMALIGQRFADATRAIDGRHVACVAGRLGEVLALARKEGYAARRSL